MTKLIRCVIDSVRVSLTNQQRVVVLRELNAERYLPIWIGLYEAESITIALQKIEVARPQTHDLLNALITTLNARLLNVEISALRDDVFYAYLVLDYQGEKKYIDCRPSDALALAARCSKDIFVEEEVLNTTGIFPEKDVSKDHTFNGEESKADITEDLAVFEDFFDNLGKNIDDKGENLENDEDQDIPE
jgi:bifunctional DNase/RNase